jgi:hypothetical protein
LTEAEAHELLVRRLGADRVIAEPGAVDEIIMACARLPLALAVAAARSQQNRFPLAVLAAELAKAESRLDALDIGDPASQVRLVLSWSYRALTASAQETFRLLGLHPGSGISIPAAASLAGLSVTEAERALKELVRASLLNEYMPGRFVLHDLLRTYAVELAGIHDPATARREATLRLLDHYTHSACAADQILNPTRSPISLPLALPAPNSCPEKLTSYHEAMAWFRAESSVLLAAQWHAANAGFDTHAWQLAWAVKSFFTRRGDWHHLITVWMTALHAGQRLGNCPSPGLMGSVETNGPVAHSVVTEGRGSR